MDTFEAFATEHDVKATAHRTVGNPSMVGTWGSEARHYLVVLSRPCTVERESLGRKQEKVDHTFALHYSMGKAVKGKPRACDVLQSAASDAQLTVNCANFADWCNELGDDPDSRAALKLYETCKAQTEKLREFLGEELFAKLLLCEE